MTKVTDMPEKPPDIYDMDEIETDAIGIRILRFAVSLVIVLGALAGAGVLSAYWLTNRPKATRRPPQKQAVLVEVREVESTSEDVVIDAMGTVVPAREVELAPQVGGEIVHVSPRFVPGGRFDAGEMMVKIDPEDFDLAVRLQQAQMQKTTAEAEQAASAVAQRETAVTRAKAALALEMGQQSVAQREFELLGQTVAPEDEALVLRKPQLEQARAEVAAAEAARRAAEAARQAVVASQGAMAVALEQAKLNLARTEVRAPFNALVRARHVDLGAQVSPGRAIASLVGTDEYWIEVSVPVDELRWMRVPGLNSDEGSTVRLVHERAWGPGASRIGRVRRLMSEVEPQGRMARLLVAVADPLNLAVEPQKRRPLILGDYVRVEIDGNALHDIVCIDRTTLRDGRRVWVMTADDTLEIRDVKIAWGGVDQVCISEGLRAGDRLIVSDLGAPVAGMPLRTENAPAREGQGAEHAGPPKEQQQ
jgi:multidrug efflux pump subunit AcrA (membrane-fusion protein)